MCWTVLFLFLQKGKNHGPFGWILFVRSLQIQMKTQRASEREKERNWKEDKSRRSWNGFALAKCDVFLKGNDIHYTHTRALTAIHIKIYIFAHRVYSAIIMVHHSSIFSLSLSLLKFITPHTYSLRWTGSFKWIGKNVLHATLFAIATQFALHGLALTGETRNYERTNEKSVHSINNKNKNTAHT